MLCVGLAIVNVITVHLFGIPCSYVEVLHAKLFNQIQPFYSMIQVILSAVDSYSASEDISCFSIRGFIIPNKHLYLLFHSELI
jgi:hypothetical protein